MRALFHGALLSIALVAAALPTRVSASEGGVVQRVSTIDGEARGIRYLVYVPSGYDSETSAAPVLVGLHGTAGAPEQILEIPGLIEQAERHGFLIVCPSTSGWYGREFWSKAPRPLSVRSDLHVADVLERTLAEFRVDEERMYLLGVSKGGAGAWHLALGHPERWAGVAPISPAGYSGLDDLERIAHVPVIIVQGEKDRAVSVSENRRVAREMERLGMRYRYLEIAGAGHDLSSVPVAEAVFEFFLGDGAASP